ncbi:MAG TPA: bifunctional alpha,alpha-trehalose-phosphate synthase (UDP-forming)/trehalose-phosphatase, partial [Chitinophagaceae bacterium]|nr:bifunctional alpha,alpha-trehalose-phosphate synthase (UDP-forming)/trehalose-phosphatase [Chitinophagaceae bacterium]
MSRMIIISNRLPISIERSGDDVVVRPSSGGLVSAIKSYLEGTANKDQHFENSIWLGSIEATEEDWNLITDMDALRGDFNVEPVFLEKEKYDAFYNGFSNSTLWPLFHYFPSLVKYIQDDFDAYQYVNAQFAAKVASIYKPGDVVWVHDYQLLLLPHLIREILPEATIGFFLHIPFPSYELFRLLPGTWKQELLKGMLGADLIGFHTHDYVQHFIQSAKMVLSVENQFSTIYFENRIIKADLFPIGIDYEKFNNNSQDKTVVAISNKLTETFNGQKIIFSVDRLDYTKGLEYRLDGYETFLKAHTDWHEKVTFIFNIVPSRDLISAYIDRKKSIEEKVSAINGRFATLHWQPIIYRYNHLDFDELCALYQVADVALITPLRDGMNLVAKEYIACCTDKGVLILSELTGAASELNEAILVNPTDTAEVASAIQTALTMPLAEQHSRLSYMKQRLADYNVVRWVNDYFDELENAMQEQEKAKVIYLTTDSRKAVLDAYKKASKRLILLDYDGTLSPIQRVPEMAKPTEVVLDILKSLSADDKTEVAVISGRDADTLEAWLGHLPIHLVAEHGALIRYKNESWLQQSSISPEWKEQVKPVLALFVSRCAGSFAEEKKNTLAWHYRNTEAGLGFTRSRELRNTLLQLTANTSLQVIDGNKVLEVRVMGIDKGATALQMTEKFSPDFTL